MAETTIHLIYIHGFQGNDKTFQSFPTHLQQNLTAQLPPHFSVQSSLYPTYKSVKPISHATKNFLEWLSTQPAGYVILLGHSMGGLLAADAATDQSYARKSRPQRIIGMIAFDTPFLGMHPHVVISGIASLFPDESKKDNGQSSQNNVRRRSQETAATMNDQKQVNIVDQEVTDNWDMFKARLPPSQRHQSSQSSTPQSPQPSLSASASISPSLTPQSFVSRLTAVASLAPYVDRTVSHPAFQWVAKHSDSPVDAGKSWVIEHFQFGACMFDPPGLRDRYMRLVAWRGRWTNYWTRTKQGEISPQPNNTNERPDDIGITASPENIHEDNQEIPESTSRVDIHAAGLTEKEDDKARKKALKKEKQEQEKRRKKEEKRARSHHFVVLPNGLASNLGGWDKWESVEIAGVPDEVAAHCGLFIPEQNLGYQDLIDGVANKVLRWCESVRRG